MKYRIVEYTDCNGDTYHMPQMKVLFWWTDMYNRNTRMNIEQCRTAIKDEMAGHVSCQKVVEPYETMLRNR